MLNWRTKRRISYVLLVIVFVVLVGILAYFFYRPAPTCFDNKQNGDETGVDCGGICVRVCSQTLAPLQTLWVRPFAVSDNIYSVAALNENSNLQTGIRNLSYTIHLTNDAGEIIASRDGLTAVLPEERFVIFEGNISSQEAVRQAFIVFPENPYWENLNINKPLLRISQQELTQDSRSRLEAVIRNETTLDLTNVEVVVVLSGPDGNAFAASRTIVESLPRLSNQTMVFTWPTLFPSTPTAIDFYPKVLDF